MDLPRSCPPAPSMLPEKMDELVPAMVAVRNDLLGVSILLCDHRETNLTARAREAATALIRQCRKG